MLVLDFFQDLPALKDVRDNSPSFRRIIIKSLMVPSVVVKCPGDKVNHCPDGEGHCGGAPGHKCKSGPFQDLSKKIRTGNISEKSSFGNGITVAGVFSQRKKDVVRTNIDICTKGKKQTSPDKT